MHTKVTTAFNHGLEDASNYHTELQNDKHKDGEKKDFSINSVIEEIIDLNTRASYDFDTTKQQIITTNRKLERQTNRVREGNKLITHLVLSLPVLDDIV